MVMSYEPILSKASTLDEAIFQALGAASVCWEPPPGNQVFDSTRAKNIGDELFRWITSRMQPVGTLDGPGQRRTRATQSERTAAATVKAKSQRHLVLQAIADGHLTACDISARVILQHRTLTPNQVATRLGELRRAGLATWTRVILDSTRERLDDEGYAVRPASPGNTGRVHVHTPAGAHALRVANGAA